MTMMMEPPAASSHTGRYTMLLPISKRPNGGLHAMGTDRRTSRKLIIRMLHCLPSHSHAAEVLLNLHIQHAYILHMLGVVADRRRKILYIIFEHAVPLHPGYFLPEVPPLQPGWGLRMSMLQSIMAHLLCAVRHLHARGITHGAISMDCITVDWHNVFSCTAKLACWDLQRSVESTVQCDLCALGRVFAQLWLPDTVTRDNSSNHNILMCVMTQKGRMPFPVSSLLVQLLSGSLHSAEQALQHPWFRACLPAQLAEPACLLDCIQLDDAPCPFQLADCTPSNALDAATLHASYLDLMKDGFSAPNTTTTTTRATLDDTMMFKVLNLLRNEDTTSRIISKGLRDLTLQAKNVPVRLRVLPGIEHSSMPDLRRCLITRLGLHTPLHLECHVASEDDSEDDDDDDDDSHLMAVPHPASDFIKEFPCAANLHSMSLQGRFHSNVLASFPNLERVTLHRFSCPGRCHTLELPPLADRLHTLCVSASTALVCLDLQRLTRLQHLQVTGCDNLVVLDASTITSLVTLDLSGCTLLHFVKLPSSLVHLESLVCAGCPSTSFDLNSCTALTRLAGAAIPPSTCTALLDLRITGPTVSGSRMLDATPFPRLQRLCLQDCHTVHCINISHRNQQLASVQVCNTARLQALLLNDNQSIRELRLMPRGVLSATQELHVDLSGLGSTLTSLKTGPTVTVAGAQACRALSHLSCWGAALIQDACYAEIRRLHLRDVVCHMEAIELSRIPRLEELVLERCTGQLQALHTHDSPSLQSLTCVDCPRLIIIRLRRAPALLRLACSMSSGLKSLEVEGAVNLASLNLKYCPLLRRLDLKHHRLLTEIRLAYCADLKSLILPENNSHRARSGLHVLSCPLLRVCTAK